MASTFGNMGFTATTGIMGDITSMGQHTLNTWISNGFKQRTGVRFYADYDAGGSVLNVLAKKLTYRAASVLKDEGMRQLKKGVDKLFGRGVNDTIQENAMSNIIKDAQVNDDEKYGTMKVDGGTVVAYDPYGNKCVDALMLSIPVKDPIQYSVAIHKKKTQSGNALGIMDGCPESNFTSHTLVWYDPTALIAINSDRNLIITKVQGRDYSRKELVSNGDINFTVTGHILSNAPEVYPTHEVQKFIQIMKYKGIVKVNNLILDQFHIDGVVIKDFALSPKEGYKSQQDYTFNAVGIMPTQEIQVAEDTINIIDNSLSKAKDKSPWLKMLEDHLEGATDYAVSVVDRGLAISTGLLDGLF